MKIALLNHTFASTDGQGKVNARVAAHLLGRGHGVTLISADRQREIDGLEDASLVTVSPARAPTRLLRHLSFGKRSAEAVRRFRSEHDLVVVNGGISFAPSDVNLCHFVHASWIKSAQHPARLAGQGPWGWYQYAYSWQARHWEADAYRRTRRVVAVSDLVKEQLVKDVGIDAAKVLVVENGLDPLPSEDGGVARERARHEFGVDDDAFVVFFAAEMKTPRKNFDVLLQAIRLLPPQVVIVAAGGYEGGPYPAMADRLGVRDRVRFLGFRRDVNGLYPGGDAFALLSHYDPCPISICEAMSAGLPVITSTTCGSSAPVRRHNAGIVIETPTDVAAIADALRLLLGDPAMRQRMGAGGQAATEELAWPKVGERYEAIFEEVASEVAAERIDRRRGMTA
jgi:glycosyltransferase involved in cell wall biosynthesis